MSSTASTTRISTSSGSTPRSTESITIVLRPPPQAENSPDLSNQEAINVIKTHRLAAAWLILGMIYNTIVEPVTENNNIPIPITCWDNYYNGEVSFVSTFVKYFIDENIFPREWIEKHENQNELQLLINLKTNLSRIIFKNSGNGYLPSHQMSIYFPYITGIKGKRDYASSALQSQGRTNIIKVSNEMSIATKNGIPNHGMLRTKFINVNDLSDTGMDYLITNILAIKEWSSAIDTNDNTYEIPQANTRMYRAEKRKFDELLQRLNSQTLSISIPSETTAAPSPRPTPHANPSVLQFCQQRGNGSLYNLQNRVSKYGRSSNSMNAICRIDSNERSTEAMEVEGQREAESERQRTMDGLITEIDAARETFLNLLHRAVADGFGRRLYDTETRNVIFNSESIMPGLAVVCSLMEGFERTDSAIYSGQSLYNACYIFGNLLVDLQEENQSQNQDGEEVNSQTEAEAEDGNATNNNSMDNL